MGDQEDKDGGGDKLIEESVNESKVSTRVGGEDSSGVLWSSDGTNSSVEDVDGVIVDAVDDGGSEEGSDGLGEKIGDKLDDGDLSNGEEGERDGWVDVSS